MENLRLVYCPVVARKIKRTIEGKVVKLINYKFIGERKICKE